MESKSPAKINSYMYYYIPKFNGQCIAFRVYIDTF